MHCPPLIYAYNCPDYTKEEMKPGMAFTIEPILHMNDKYTYDLWSD